MEYQLIKVQHIDNYYHIMMNRPDVHNAFNDQMISELTHAFKNIPESAKFSVLEGAGKSFSAGADLNWMKSMVNYSKKENIEDSMKLAELFNVINSNTKPVLGLINGHALGGGAGLVSVCDYALTHNKAKFGFTEVKLGLIPAVISPFVIDKIGRSHARSLFLCGKKFSAHHAYHIGLVHEVVDVQDFDSAKTEIIKEFQGAGAHAQIKAKKLITEVMSGHHDTIQKMSAYTAGEIAATRISEEGQEGMSALLEKRPPNWNKE